MKFTDVAFGQYLINKFDSFIEPPDPSGTPISQKGDVIWSPMESAYENRKKHNEDNDYDLPFISYYRPDTHNLAKSRHTQRMTKGCYFYLPGDDPSVDDGYKATIVPQTVQYEVHFYIANRTEKDSFNTHWNKIRNEDRRFDVLVPVNDDESFEATHSMSFTDLEDLSEVDSAMDTGVEFHLQGTVTTDVYSFQIEEADAPVIRQIMLELYAKEIDPDARYLIREITEDSFT